MSGPVVDPGKDRRRASVEPVRDSCVCLRVCVCRRSRSRSHRRSYSKSRRRSKSPRRRRSHSRDRNRRSRSRWASSTDVVGSVFLTPTLTGRSCSLFCLGTGGRRRSRKNAPRRLRRATAAPGGLVASTGGRRAQDASGEVRHRAGMLIMFS